MNEVEKNELVSQLTDAFASGKLSVDEVVNLVDESIGLNTAGKDQLREAFASSNVAAALDLSLASLSDKSEGGGSN